MYKFQNNSDIIELLYCTLFILLSLQMYRILRVAKIHRTLNLKTYMSEHILSVNLENFYNYMNYMTACLVFIIYSNVEYMYTQCAYLVLY